MQSPHSAVVRALWLDLGQESCLTWREILGESCVGPHEPNRKRRLIPRLVQVVPPSVLLKSPLPGAGYKSPLPEAVYKVVESIAMLRTGEASVVEVQEDAPESNS